MKLFWSSRSPFVRKVMVAAHETGIVARIHTERVVVAANKPNVYVMALNPLNKIPTLVLDDGTALYDSRVICEYFDAQHHGAKLFPADPIERWPALRRQALGDGLMETNVARLGEQSRPQEAQSGSHLTAYGLKIKSALDRIEPEPLQRAAQRDIGHIAIACALAHLDFRYPNDNWRATRPRLTAWFAEFSGRASMRATEYVDAY